MAPMKVGFHVSIAGGISNAVDNATKIGCTAFQIFSRNPRGWTAKPLDPKDVESFKNKLADSRIQQDSVIVHMPYLPNLSGSGESYEKSVETLAGEITRCSTLGISNLVIHLGSHMGRGRDAGISQIVEGIKRARHQARNSELSHPVRILLENSAGQKNWVGSTFAELRLILDSLLDSERYGVCLDTCHLFASGHDLRTKHSVDETLADFDSLVGFDRLAFIHLNDSVGGLNSGLDRHDHIGLGSIGKTGLAAFLNHNAVRKLPKIMETPMDARRGDEENMRIVLGMVK
jgi:deoxyribonuclease-4